MSNKIHPLRFTAEGEFLWAVRFIGLIYCKTADNMV